MSSQDEYSLLARDIERELLPLIEKYGMSELPYFPLASGLLTGKHKRGQPAAKGTRLAEKQFLADRYMQRSELRQGASGWNISPRSAGHSLLELAFSWLVSHPVVASVIAGATKPEQIEANVQAAGWALSKDDLAEVDQITSAKEVETLA